MWDIPLTRHHRGPRRGESPNVDCFCHVSFQSDPSRRVTICLTSHVFFGDTDPHFFLKEKSAAIVQKRQTVETAIAQCGNLWKSRDSRADLPQIFLAVTL